MNNTFNSYETILRVHFRTRVRSSKESSFIFRRDGILSSRNTPLQVNRESVLIIILIFRFNSVSVPIRFKCCCAPYIQLLRVGMEIYCVWIIVVMLMCRAHVRGLRLADQLIEIEPLFRIADVHNYWKKIAIIVFIINNLSTRLPESLCS